MYFEKVALHPLNNRAVQELLVRAAHTWNTNQRECFLRAAANLAHEAEVVHRRSRIKGVGNSIGNVVNAVTMNDLDDGTSTTFEYDDITAFIATTQTALRSLDGGYIAHAVGPYRRGAPATRRMDVLVTHVDEVAGTETLREEKALDHLVRSEVVARLPRRTGWFVGPRSGAERVCNRRLHWHWSPYSAYFCQLLLMTGPLTFNAQMMLEAKKARLVLSSDGLGGDAANRLIYQSMDSEHAVFERLSVPYVDPMCRT